MDVAAILREKGTSVITSDPDATIAQIVGTLSRKRVGVVVICKEDGAKTVVDTSGEALAGVVKEGAWLIKPNREEFASLTGCQEQSIEQIARAGHKLTEQVQNILLSLGEQGALLINEKAAIWAVMENTKATKKEMKLWALCDLSVSCGFSTSSAVMLIVSC